MDSNNATRTAKAVLKSGLQVDRITRIIIEQWPEIWQASLNRQRQLLDNQRSLLLTACSKLHEEPNTL